MRRFESARGLLSALLPAALLLLWSGVAATAVTAFVAAPLLDERGAALAFQVHRPSTTGAVLLGVFAYPPVYALGFALLNEASLLTGALLGTCHAFLFGLLAMRAGGVVFLRASARRLLLYVLYGAFLGFAFLTP